MKKRYATIDTKVRVNDEDMVKIGDVWVSAYDVLVACGKVRTSHKKNYDHPRGIQPIYDDPAHVAHRDSERKRREELRKQNPLKIDPIGVNRSVECGGHKIKVREINRMAGLIRKSRQGVEGGGRPPEYTDKAHQDAANYMREYRAKKRAEKAAAEAKAKAGLRKVTRKRTKAA